MHQRRPPPAPSGPEASQASSALSAARHGACSSWTLFSVDEEFEDEDFLSAVEDAENQLAGAEGRLARASSGLRPRRPSPPALRPAAASVAQCPPALGLCHTVPRVPSAPSDPQRLCLTSSNWTGGQRTHGAWGGPAQGDLDEVLASLELELGADARGPAPAKRARILGLSELVSGPAAAPAPLVPPAPSGPHRIPRPLLKPSVTRADAILPGHLPQPLSPLVAPGRGCTRPPPRTCAGASPHPAVPRAGPAASCRAALPPCTPVSSPISTPRGTRSSLQIPVVTNHLVQLVTATTRVPACSRTRRFPGPAGLLPQQHGEKNPEEIMVSTPQTPAHGALAKLHTEATITSSQALAVEDFRHGPWLAMKAALGLDDSDPACFLHTCSVAMVLRKAALKQLPGNKVPTMAVLVKSLTLSTVDASVVLRDPTGEMRGTVHRALLEARRGELRPGAVLLLRQVGVFSPSLRSHYLNVTPSNLIRIYSPDSRDGGLLGPQELIPEGPGSPQGRLQLEVALQPGRGLGPVAPEEEAQDTDDLDGLLRELPEDLFSASCSSGHPTAGPL